MTDDIKSLEDVVAHLIACAVILERRDFPKLPNILRAVVRRIEPYLDQPIEPDTPPTADIYRISDYQRQKG